MKLRRPLRLGLLRLSLLAIVVGVITGFGAVLFRALIGIVHNVAFLGLFAIDYDASIAQRNFTIAREADIMFDVVQRMGRRSAAMAVVIKDGGRGRPSEIAGIISKEDIAASVTDSIKPFG